MNYPIDFAAEGWHLHDSHGFLAHVGPIWERPGADGPLLAFQAAPHHENLRGVVQGGMIATFADRLLGATGRFHNANRPQATVQLDLHFLAAVRIGNRVEGSARLVRDTRALMFIEGKILVENCAVATARGIWKKLDA